MNNVRNFISSTRAMRRILLIYCSQPVEGALFYMKIVEMDSLLVEFWFDSFLVSYMKKMQNDATADNADR